MRLIDADEIRKAFDSETWQGEMMIAIADTLPTAFNVEAVVEELEDMKLIRVEQCHEDYELEVMTASNFDDAIEILKGGVNHA